MEKPLVGILMGSDSDYDVMEEAIKIMKIFELECEVVVSSAHRSPQRTIEYARKAAERGIKVLIAGAGGAAHLAGMIASETLIPVIGVPIDSSPLKGLDSLLSTVQMPKGIPVATVGIGKSGAANAALLAIEIIALENHKLRDKLSQYRKKMVEDIAEKSELLQKKIEKDYEK